ncbi:MAG TPA: hypothetical protein VKP30_21945 [Polyangiaceae bacterium]|nr:hypothetical protein [Polyangiaceae bacterium]
MTNRLLYLTLAVLGLLPTIPGCADDSPEYSGAIAEQACLTAHTDHGYFNFNGFRQQICGANRHDLAVTRLAGNGVVLPSPRAGLSFDLNLTAVLFSDSVGATVNVSRIASGSACGNALSWHFDDDSNPTRIVLCNHDAGVNLSGAVYVDLLVGCATSPTANAGSVPSSATSNGTGCAAGQCASACATGQCASVTWSNTGILCGATTPCATGLCGATNQTTTWTGCSCLWNIVFLENGCTEPPKPSNPEPSSPEPSGPVLL